MTKRNVKMASYDEQPVLKAVLQNAVPAIAAMIMVLIYNLADTFFIAQTKNDYMIAAVSLATPAFLIFMALGNLVRYGRNFGNLPGHGRGTDRVREEGLLILHVGMCSSWSWLHTLFLDFYG